jgi:hypothetical protein
VLLPPADQLPMLAGYLRKRDGKDKGKIFLLESGEPGCDVVMLDNQRPWVPGYVKEHKDFSGDDTHRHDDQIDPTLDAVQDMLLNNDLSTWANL